MTSLEEDDDLPADHLEQDREKSGNRSMIWRCIHVLLGLPH